MVNQQNNELTDVFVFEKNIKQRCKDAFYFFELNFMANQIKTFRFVFVVSVSICWSNSNIKRFTIVFIKGVAAKYQTFHDCCYKSLRFVD
jgi:hypothetical protein